MLRPEPFCDTSLGQITRPRGRQRRHCITSTQRFGRQGCAAYFGGGRIREYACTDSDGPPFLHVVYPRLPFDDTFVVTARDGTLFACWLEVIENEIRWMFITSDRAEYFGPLYGGENSVGRIQELVDRWWVRRRESPNPLNAFESLRDRYL